MKTDREPWVNLTVPPGILFAQFKRVRFEIILTDGKIEGIDAVNFQDP